MEMRDKRPVLQLSGRGDPRRDSKRGGGSAGHSILSVLREDLSAGRKDGIKIARTEVSSDPSIQHPDKKRECHQDEEEGICVNPAAMSKYTAVIFQTKQRSFSQNGRRKKGRR